MKGRYGCRHGRRWSRPPSDPPPPCPKDRPSRPYGRPRRIAEGSGRRRAAAAAARAAASCPLTAVLFPQTTWGRWPFPGLCIGTPPPPRRSIPPRRRTPRTIPTPIPPGPRTGTRRSIDAPRRNRPICVSVPGSFQERIPSTSTIGPGQCGTHIPPLEACRYDQQSGGQDPPLVRVFGGHDSAGVESRRLLLMLR